MTKQNRGINSLKYQIDFFKKKRFGNRPCSEPFPNRSHSLRGVRLVAIVVVASLARIVHLPRQIVAHQLLDLASLTANDLNAVAFEHVLGTCTHIARQHNSHTLSL